MAQGRLEFRIPVEGEKQEVSARRYVQRAWGRGTEEQIQALFDQGQVWVDDILATRPDEPLMAGATVVVELKEAGKEPFGVPEVETLERGSNWVIVDKPMEMPGRIDSDDPSHPIRFMADVLGLDRDSIAPIFWMDEGCTGPWWLATDKDAAETWRYALAKEEVKTTWHAVIERPGRAHGEWETEFGALRYATARTEGALAEVQLMPSAAFCDHGDRDWVGRLRQALASLERPIVGDERHGGYMVSGGLRLRLATLYDHPQMGYSWTSPRGWWPEAPTVVDEKATSVAPPQDSIGTWKASQEQYEALLIGRRWLLRRDYRNDQTLPAPGDLVEVKVSDTERDVFALVDDHGPISARLWSRSRSEAEAFEEEVAIRVDEAIGRRAERFEQMGDSEAFRVVHSDGDELPGVVVDRLGGMWRVELRAPCARRIVDPLCDALHRSDLEAALVIIDRRNGVGELREAGARRFAIGEAWVVREGGLRFGVAVDHLDDMGLRVEERGLRDQVVDRAMVGERWLCVGSHGGVTPLRLAASQVKTVVAGPLSEPSVWEANKRYQPVADELWKEVDIEAIAGEERSLDGAFIRVVLQEERLEEAQPVWVERLRRVFLALKEGGQVLVAARRPIDEATLTAWIEEASAAAEIDVDDEEAALGSDVPQLKEHPLGPELVARWVYRRER